jgi:ATP-dependent Clp protease protease subunit
MDSETWLTASECEEYGFCDVVEEEENMAASIDVEVLERYRNTPKVFLTEEPKLEKNGQNKERELLKQKLLIELEL